MTRVKIARASPAGRGGTSTLSSAGEVAFAATSYSTVTPSTFGPYAST